MTYYTRKQLIELLEIDEGFLTVLEREEIVERDAESGAQGEFSEIMLERARVAHNLMRDLDVNLPGVAIIVRMREELSELQRSLARLAAELRRLQ